jgi:hypothetical protein
MTPTTTEPCIKPHRDGAEALFLHEEGLNRKGNEREPPNSAKTDALSPLQSSCISQPQTMLEAMDSTAAPEVSANQERRLVDFTGMTDAVYPLIWSFLLDSTSCKACLLDFQSIRSFMLVNKTSKGAFDDCRGWRFCARALKEEAEAEKKLAHHFVERNWVLGDDFFYVPSFLDELEQAIKTNARILLIQETLLPKASLLAVAAKKCPWNTIIRLDC